MPTSIGPSGKQTKIVNLNETADIQVALKYAIYGNSTASTVDADSLYANLATKSQSATNSATTFTGTVVLPSTTSIANSDGTDTLISATELSYLDGATSNIQTQINNMINESSFWYGSGADGSVTLNASTSGYSTWATKSGSVYTLTRDVYFTNLTIDNTYTLDPNGFRIFATGTVTLSGTNAITHTPANGGAGGDGSSGVQGTAGAAGTSTANLNSYYGNVSSGTAGGLGGLKVTGTGGNGFAGTAQTITYPTWSKIYTPAIGGTGAGAGSGSSGGAGGTSSTPTTGIQWRRAFVDWISPFLSGVPISGAGGTGGGGQAGSSSSYGAGGGGGGSGNTGVFIFAKTLSIAAATNVIKFIGGNGGAGGNGSGGGGGAGGQGGFVYLVYSTITGGISSSQINVSGGTGGGATNVGSGGYSGVVCFVNLSTGVVSSNLPIAPSGATGGSYAIPRL